MRDAAPFPIPREPRILLVDDDEAGRYAKARILRHAGYQVVEAGRGADALKRIADSEPDLILLDVRLPDVSGLEICKRIKENPATSAIPVLQMSASFCDDQSKVAGLEGGADGYIAEPVDPSLLLATIGAFLRTRMAEQAVRESALELQATFDAITDGVALVDGAGRIRRANHALGSLFGRPAEELLGENLRELLAGAGGAGLWAALEHGKAMRAEVPYGNRFLTLALDPVCDPRGHLRGAVCVVSDITDRKLMDERLWHTQKLESIGVLAGGVAHDFNNLLMGILGNASLAMESLDNTGATERALRDIVAAGERAADLTRQLLAYSGKGKVMVHPVDLSSLVAGMAPLVKASFPGRVHLVLNLDRNLPAVEADRTQLEQVIMNLLINAAEAIGEGAGTVQVTTGTRHFAKDARQSYISEAEVSGSYVRFEVRDDGVGMTDEVMRRIFDPFFTTKFLGRGLGLSAVLGIMRSHKGAIGISSAPGRGTTFELLFPSAEASLPQSVPEIAAEAARPHGRGRVLVVDDEPIIRDFFQAALDRQGYEVRVANNGDEAVRLFAESPALFSMVLLDLVMPVMSGKEALPRLLEIRPDLKVVITSGQVEEEVRRELRGWPIAGFIQKPCAIGPFLDKIREYAAAEAIAAD